MFGVCSVSWEAAARPDLQLAVQVRTTSQPCSAALVGVNARVSKGVCCAEETPTNSALTGVLLGSTGEPWPWVCKCKHKPFRHLRCPRSCGITVSCDRE